MPISVPLAVGLVAAVLGGTLFLAYLCQRARVAAGVYSPQLAWLRAGMAFCVSAGLALASGALERVMFEPLVRSDQWGEWLWWLMTAGALAVIVFGYGVLWPRGTFSDGRARHVPTVLVYGVLWGLSQGLLFLSFWLLIGRLGFGPIWTAVLAYLAIGGFQGVWHHYFWDVYVSPPHNYTEWNGRKVALAHTPNLMMCLTHLTLFDNAAIFVLLQTLALTLSSWFMRFPPFWSDYRAAAGQERSVKDRAV